MSEMSQEAEDAFAARLAPGAESDETGADDLVVEQEPTTEGTPESEETPLIFGKYKSVEEAEQAFAHLESKLGEQGSELGQTRQELEQLRVHVERAQAPRYDADRLDEWLDENIAHVPQLAEQARQRGDGALFDAAMEKWYEMSPRHAARYERALEMQELRGELGTTTARLTAPAQQLQVERAQQEAVGSLSGKFEDFAEVMGGMSEERISAILRDPTFPSELLSQINPGDPAAQEKLLGTLYRFAKTEQVGPLSEVAADAARTAQSEARAAKRDGTLPAASGSGTHEAAPEAARQFKNLFRAEFGLPQLD